MELESGVVDFGGSCVRRGDGVVGLTPMEARLLRYLSEHPGRDISRDELLGRVWSYANSVVSRTVTATVHRLRAKIERDPADPDHILTVRGHGFRFEPKQSADGRGRPPSPTRPIVGRQSLLAAVHRELALHRLVTLVGPGGIGKTRLAAELAGQADGPSLWVDLQSVGDAAGLVRQVSLALGLDPGSGADSLIAALAAHGDLVLILDNVEQVAAEVHDRLTSWLDGAPQVRLLCTSRVPLDRTDERIVSVGPLDPSSAGQLFDAHCPLGPRSDANERLAVLEVLDGFPLALLLAARLRRTLSLADLALALRRPIHALDRGARDLPLRHQSLERALLGSWVALSDAQRQALGRLASFRGVFRLDAASAVLGEDALTLLTELADASLLCHAGDGMRMLVPIRYFVEGCAEEPESARQARIVAWLVAESQRRFTHVADDAALKWARTYLADLLHHHGRALESGSLDAVPLCEALAAHHAHHGPAPAMVEGVRRTLELELPAADRCRLACKLAGLLMCSGDLKASHRASTDAVALAEQLDDTTLLGRACLSLLFNEDASDPESPLLRRTMEAQLQAGDQASLASTYQILAQRVTGVPDLAEGIALYRHAERLHRQSGHVRGVAAALRHCGLALAASGDPASAQLLNEALQMVRDSGARRHEAETLCIMGRVALLQGRWDDAVARCTSALEIGERCGASVYRVGLFAFLIAIGHALADRLDEAQRSLRRCREITSAGGFASPFQVWTECWVSAHLQDPEPGLRLLESPPEGSEHGITQVLEALLRFELARCGRLPMDPVLAHARRTVLEAPSAMRSEQHIGLREPLMARLRSELSTRGRGRPA